MEQMVPILTIAEHKKLNNRESTFFAMKPVDIFAPKEKSRVSPPSLSSSLSATAPTFSPSSLSSSPLSSAIRKELPKGRIDESEDMYLPAVLNGNDFELP